jgi:hypothetical protein
LLPDRVPQRGKHMYTMCFLCEEWFNAQYAHVTHCTNVCCQCFHHPLHMSVGGLVEHKIDRLFKEKGPKIDDLNAKINALEIENKRLKKLVANS